jgi:hypothetical protein
MLENLFEIPNLVDVNKMLFTIPLHLHAQEKMQVFKIFHFELLKKFFLHLHKLVSIIAHQNETIDIENNEKLNISFLHNVHTKIDITPHKLDVFQECI